MVGEDQMSIWKKRKNGKYERSTVITSKCRGTLQVMMVIENKPNPTSQETRNMV